MAAVNVSPAEVTVLLRLNEKKFLAQLGSSEI